MVPALASADHDAALDEARRLAAQSGRSPGAADVLLGILRAGGAAARLLGERGVASARLEAALAEVRLEAGFDLGAVDRTSYDVAGQLGAARASSIHLLVALLRGGGSAADLLRRAGHDPSRIRAVAMRALTGPARIGERATRRGGSDLALPATAPSLPDGTGAGLDAAMASTLWAGAPAVKPTVVADRPAPVAVDGGVVETPARAAEDDLLPIEAPLWPVLHRERETARLLDVLGSASGRIACLVGEPGAGKSAVLASAAGRSSVPFLAPAEPAAPGVSAAVWLRALDAAAPREAPLLLDGWRPGPGETPEAASHLAALARAGRRFILALTPPDLARLEREAPVLADLLEIIDVAPLSPDAARDVLDAALEGVSEREGVSFVAGATGILLSLARRYPSPLVEPGRALVVADLAASRAARLGKRSVTATEIADVVAEAAALPPARLLRTDDERWAGLEAALEARVVAQVDARAQLVEALRRGWSGLAGPRPLGTLLLLGPPGVGRTETARTVAEALFDGEAALCRVDLGEAGDEGLPRLAEALRWRPASVVLLEQPEKAPRGILLALGEALATGQLRDVRGRTVDLSSTIVMLTSTLGSELYFRSATRAPSPSTVVALAKSRLPAALWDACDEVLCYAPLSDAELRRVAGLLASASCRRLATTRAVKMTVDPSVIDRVVTEARDAALGARPLRRAWERLVEGAVAAQLLSVRVPEGASLFVLCARDGSIETSLR